MESDVWASGVGETCSCVQAQRVVSRDLQLPIPTFCGEQLCLLRILVRAQGERHICSRKAQKGCVEREGRGNRETCFSRPDDERVRS